MLIKLYNEEYLRASDINNRKYLFYKFMVSFKVRTINHFQFGTRTSA